MTIDLAQSIITRGILTIIICSAPSIGFGLLIGFLISLFQAVTQIQEQTLTFVPKMLTVLLIIAVTFPWMGALVVSLSTDLWVNLPIYAK